MNEAFNITEQVMDWQSEALYNPSCIAEMEKFEHFCTDFRADVISNISTRFKVAVIIMITLVILRFFLEYSNLHDKEWFKFLIKRIDFALIVTAIITIGLMFI